MFYLLSLTKLFNIQNSKLIFLLFLLIIYAFLEIIGIGFLISIVINILNFQSQCIFKNQFVDLNFLCNLDSSELLFITLGFFVFKLFYQVLVYYYRISILVNGMNFFLKNNMTKFIFLKPDMVEGLNFFESNTVLLKEIENVFKSYADKILDFISEFFVFLVLSLTFIIILINLNLIPAILLIVFFIVFVLFLSKTTKNIGEKRTQSLIELNKNFYEIFKNLDILNVFNKNQQFVNLVETRIKNYRDGIKYSNLISKLPKFFFEFIIICSLLFFALFSMKNANINIVALTTISLIFLRLYPTITRMKTSYDNALFNKYSAIKTIKLLEEISLIKNSETNQKIFTLNDQIKFKKILIKKKDKKIINEIDFSLDKNDKILLKGETGSGKSTFLKFLSGIQSGNFQIYKNEGQRENFTSTYLKLNMVSYIPQNPILFNFSIAQNISMELNNENIDYEKISNLFKELRLNKFCDYLDQKLSLDGSSISGGERQRMSIARGLYNDPEVIIMDEPFSSVDDETRDIITNFLKKISLEKTLIISSHNKENENLYNKIYTVKDGNINEN